MTILRSLPTAASTRSGSAGTMSISRGSHRLVRPADGRDHRGETVQALFVEVVGQASLAGFFAERLRRERSVVYRAWQLKKALRDVYRLREFGAAHQFLDRWLAWACRSRIPSFVRLGRTIRARREGILEPHFGA